MIVAAPLAKPMSVEEFLGWERRQELRYEFDGVQPVAMTGGTVAHSVIATNVVRALEERLSGPCRVFRGDLKVIVAGRVRYPDAVVTCAPIPDNADVVPEPLVIFEVLSASTAIIDRNIKAAEYWDTPSIMRYVLLEQTKAEATVLHRSGEGGSETVLSGPNSVLTLPEVGSDIPVAEFYRRIQLPT